MDLSQRATLENAAPNKDTESMDETGERDGSKGHSDSGSGKIPSTRRGTMTTHACISCRDKRTKCDGGRPCDRCRRRNVECRYVGKLWQSKGGLRQETEGLRSQLRKRETILQALASQPDPHEILQMLRNGESIDTIYDGVIARQGDSLASDLAELDKMHQHQFSDHNQSPANTLRGGDAMDIVAPDNMGTLPLHRLYLQDSPGTGSSISGASSSLSGGNSGQSDEQLMSHNGPNLAGELASGNFSISHLLEYSETCEWPPCSTTDCCQKHMQQYGLPNNNSGGYSMTWPSSGNSGYDNMPPS